jgi:hypothetical protein
MLNRNEPLSNSSCNVDLRRYIKAEVSLKGGQLKVKQTQEMEALLARSAGAYTRPLLRSQPGLFFVAEALIYPVSCDPETESSVSVMATSPNWLRRSCFANCPL